jgi:hypothetical protein
MADEVAGRVRLAETFAGLERLDREIAVWVACRQGRGQL